jgi:hypothetical protein
VEENEEIRDGITLPVMKWKLRFLDFPIRAGGGFSDL